MAARLLVAATLLALCPACMADAIGRIKTLAGTVHIVRDGARHPASLGEPVEQNDTIVTADDGSVGITFIDNSRFAAGPGSRLELARFRFDLTTHEGEFLTRLRQGTLSIVSGQMAKRSPQAMQVETPITVLGVRGTEFVIKVNKESRWAPSPSWWPH
ncbi:MAG: FecR domain-containing protein [Pseudomonadota bacterium]|nr:FecR domain-containing protein [Pseudomonadota bacterium]